MRLIDADYILSALGVFTSEEPESANFMRGIRTAREIVENAPTVAMGDRWATIKWTPDLDKFAQDVAYRGLDEFSFMGKSIREWVEIILEHTAREKQSGWINVKDRLPDKYGPYLTLRAGANINWLKMAVRYWTGDDECDYWCGAEAGSRITGITHWRPLPEPPKEDE